MAPPETEGVLRSIAERLLTLRVTVVLSDRLETVDAGPRLQDRKRALYLRWSDYVGGSEPRPDELQALATTREEVVDFGALAARARSALAAAPPEPSDGFVGAMGQQPEPDSSPRGSGERRAAPRPDVLERIASFAERLDAMPQGDSGRIEEQMLVAKALALGTDPVLLETEIRLDGDVTTRVNRAWLEEDDAEGTRTRLILDLQRMGMETAVSWWSGLVEMVAKAGKSLIELVLGK